MISWEKMFASGGIPTVREMWEIPPWAMVTFANRCAQRLQPYFSHLWPNIPANFAKAIARGLKSPETLKSKSEALELIHEITDVVNATNKFRPKENIKAHSLFQAAYAVNLTVYATNTALRQAFNYTAENAVDAGMCVANVNPDLIPYVRNDFNLLKEAHLRHKWEALDKVPLNFFIESSEFNIPTNTSSNHQIITFQAAVDENLVNYFRKYPRRLYDMNPFRFEELVAEIVRVHGFDVELTAKTKDKGVDIIAVSNNLAKIKYIIECKRYSEDRPISIGIVQRMLGAIDFHSANKGLIVTTSYFSRDANMILKEREWKLEGIDFNGVMNWLDSYQQQHIQKSTGLITI